MTDRQVNVLEMYLRVLKVLDTYGALWSINAKFSANQQVLSTNTQTIEKWKSKQSVNTTGVAEDKQALKKRLIKLATRVAAGLQSHAADSNDATLAAQANYKVGKLSRMRENLLPTASQLLFELATARLSDLGEDGIAAPLLDELKAASDQLAAELPDAQLAMGETKTATATMPQLYTQCNTLLKKQMDTKMKQFEESQPEFFSAYFNARILLDRGKGKGKVSQLTVNS
jgi:hypothetical protein